MSLFPPFFHPFPPPYFLLLSLLFSLLILSCCRNMTMNLTSSCYSNPLINKTLQSMGSASRTTSLSSSCLISHRFFFFSSILNSPHSSHSFLIPFLTSNFFIRTGTFAEYIRYVNDTFHSLKSSESLSLASKSAAITAAAFAPPLVMYNVPAQVAPVRRV